MPHGQRVLSQKYPMYGNGGGFMSRILEAQSGWPPPEFRSGPPSQLASWTDVGWNWGPASDVPILQSRMRELLEKDINLVSIIQVMLIRRMLPCKRRPLWMWEFNPEGPRTIKHFFGLKLEGMCKLFFEPQVKCLDTLLSV